jgi:hypothetical protein
MKEEEKNEAKRAGRKPYDFFTPWLKFEDLSYMGTQTGRQVQDKLSHTQEDYLVYDVCISIERSNTRYEVLCSLAILWKYRPYLYYGGPKFEKPTRAESKECA